jgi:curli biogenesis system outer membrane secretion channel CsgG
MNTLLTRLLISALSLSLLGGCATETNTAVAPQQARAASKPYSGPKSTVFVGKFANRSSYMRGMFSDGVDRLGGQAKTTLITHLQQTGRFIVVDRDNMEEMKQEMAIKGEPQALKSADYVITGDISEFGRKETGDAQLFGILGASKVQVAYAKVSLYVTNLSTSEVVYSVQGGGEYALSNREVLGFGGTAGYDSTLNGKVLDLAIREALDALVTGVEEGKWTPTK